MTLHATHFPPPDLHQSAPQSTLIEVCTDCVQYLANAEVTNSHGEDITAAHGAAVLAVWGRNFDLTLGATEGACPWCVADGGHDGGTHLDCSPWFSGQDCDGCGSTLGGDREHATAWAVNH